MNINKIAVIGGGTMGNGIVHVFALNGFQVTLVELKEEFAAQALKAISSNLDRQIKKGSVTEQEANEALLKI